MNLNGDNSMAMGISFMAANSSTQFKAKKLFLTHGPAYSTHVVVKEKGTGVELNSTTIFEPFNSYNARHIMQLENIPQQDLDVEIETIPLEGSHTPKRDNFKMRYSVTGIDDFLKNETLKDRINATLRFGFMVDSYGLPGLGFSDIVYLLEVEEKKPKSSRTNSTNDTETEEKKEEEETIKVRSANPDN